MDKAVSFDLDGTLTSTAFADGIWDEGLPRALAAKHALTFEAAREFCRAAYASAGDDSLRWYQMSYWLEAFDLKDLDTGELFQTYTPRICLFPDVIPALRRLKHNGGQLVIFSNAARAFLDMEVAVTGLAPYFNAIISVTDDWGMVKTDPEAFARLRSLVGPCVHVGDNLRHDVLVPCAVGIEAYHIWRGSGERRAESMESLLDLVETKLDPTPLHRKDCH